MKGTFAHHCKYRKRVILTSIQERPCFATNDITPTDGIKETLYVECHIAGSKLNTGVPRFIPVLVIISWSLLSEIVDEVSDMINNM